METGGVFCFNCNRVVGYSREYGSGPPEDLKCPCGNLTTVFDLPEYKEGMAARWKEALSKTTFFYPYFKLMCEQAKEIDELKRKLNDRD